MTDSRYYVLTRRPNGMPEKGVFELRNATLPELQAGEVRIRNRWLSVDPYMRGRMDGVRTYIEPFELEEPLEGGALGEVIESRHDDFTVGDRVIHMAGWRDTAQLPGDQVQPLPNHEVPEQAFLGVLGMPGMTAWLGLEHIAELKSSDRVLVSAASGAVGSLAAQLARLKGCDVIGTAGSTSKREWLEERGIRAVNHRQTAEALTRDLQQAAPDGIDVYYENVGGTMLEAALNVINPFGRIAVCGMIAHYNDTEPAPGPSNITHVLLRRLRMQGFIVLEHMEHYPRFVSEVGPRVERGEIDYEETVFEGLKQTPDAFLSLFEGGNTGKMLVRLEGSDA
ncbi:NADP-dependent oxidoreductase [Kushneria phosphatilytica]|uniref:NADP-dependent oxidoreductase n=1 Tax=Kushneria phosphatilytica TaxID=657387 RepID=A0A1S1NYC6_9GAMM|nr:NADP-dependent oxidoreductase [Kushneria phosphatilytica]OHV11853.1 NADP-dependent oxidoreductase [Kushneria phosphatilytica]QEL11026.1 NADP-dependent oxidoreductase [Kushneria phosphatilytica]